MHGRRKLRFGLAFFLGACATGISARPSGDLTAEEYERAAEREHRLADEEVEKVRGAVEPGARLPGEGGWSWSAPFDSSFEPGQPEYYTVDPRVHDPDEKHVDRAREHRGKADWYESQAARKRRSY